MTKRQRILGLAFIGALSASSFAATTGTLLLQGTVAEVLNIVVTPEAVASTLDLATTQSDLLVATVNEQSNSNSGYTISISSANDGNLLRSGGTETFAYTLKYAGASVSLAGSSSTPVTAKTQSTAGTYDVNSNVEVSYTGVPATSMVAGTYADTLTFEISAI